MLSESFSGVFGLFRRSELKAGTVFPLGRKPEGVLGLELSFRWKKLLDVRLSGVWLIDADLLNVGVRVGVREPFDHEDEEGWPTSSGDESEPRDLGFLGSIT